MSGAERCDGSNSPLPFASSAAEPSMPIEPLSIAVSSERMSPNMLPVTMTSKLAGVWPALSYPAWRDTAVTLQLWTQIVGKVRLALTCPCRKSNPNVLMM